MIGACGRTKIAGGLPKEVQPSLEMPAINRQGCMRRNRAAMIDPRHQRDRRPERHHALEMRLPVADPRLEDRPKQRISLDPSVEAVDEVAKDMLVEPGLRHDLCRHLRSGGGSGSNSFSNGHGRFTISGLRSGIDLLIGIVNTYSSQIAVPMRLTSFTDYGLRMLMRIAGAPDRAFSTAELATEFGLSRHHLAKVMQRLAQAGIVETRRGTGGGAVLMRSASQIRLGDIVSALEEGQPLVECMSPDGSCSLDGRCGLKVRLRSAEAAFLAELDRSTLADIALAPPFSDLKSGGTPLRGNG